MKKTTAQKVVYSFFLAVGLLVTASLMPIDGAAQSLYAPSAPLNVTAVPGDTQVVISWYPPTSNGGASITHYIVSGPPPLSSQTVSASATSYTYSGLTNGTSYAFSVAAENSVGVSPFAGTVPSSVSPTKGSTVLNAAATLNITPADTTAVASGQISGITDRSILDNIKFQWRGVSDPDVQSDIFDIDSQNNFTYTIKSLKAGTTYTYVMFYTDPVTNSNVNLVGPSSFTTTGGTTGTGANGNNGGGTQGTPTASNAQIKLDLDNPLGATKTLPDFLARALDAVVILLAPIVVILLIYSGFLFVTARGSTEKLPEAKKTLMYTLIGAAIVLCAKGLSLFLVTAIGCLAGTPGC